MTRTSVYREVIVGSDGSDTATNAVRAAVALAAHLGATLSIATAWYREQPDAPSRAEAAEYPGGSPASHEAAWATETTSTAAALARAAGIEDVRQLQPVGGPADALVRLAEERPGSLIVVGTVGLGQRAERLLGNVPHQLTHHVSRDLFLAARHHDGAPSWGTVALATDGSPTAALACEHGFALAKAVGAEPVLLTVARDEDDGQARLEQAAQQFPGADTIERQVAVGTQVAEALVDAAGQHDLLVLGNKGMSGPSRLLGSVANRVTHAVPTDLLLVNTTR